MADQTSSNSDYTTKLSPTEESKFQSWVKDNKIPWRESTTADYDMRGYWKAQQAGDPNAKRAANLHFPDTYKTPYHKTFSNESKYATKDAPHWEGNKLIDKNGKVVADETPSDTAYPDLKPGKPTIQEFLGKVYANPKYKALSPELKQKFDDQTYDKFVVPYYQKIAKSDPPKKEDWLKTPAELRPKIQDQITLSQAGKYTVAGVSRMTRGGEKIAKNVMDLAFNVFEPGDKYEKEVYHQYQNHADKWFDDRIQHEDQLINKTDLHQRDHDPIKKSIDFAMDHTADLALFKAVGSVGHTVTEGLTPVLSKTPLGKYVLRSVVGAADGYASGYGLTGKKEEAESWAKFGGSIGVASAAGSDLLQSWRARKYFATVMGLMGPNWLSESLKSSAAKMEANEFLTNVAKKTTDPSDPLVRKLNQTNAIVYNDYARKMYPHKSGYTALSKYEKDDVLQEVFKDVKAAGQNPAAYSKETNLYTIENANSKAVKEPVVRQGVQNLRKATQKVTGSADMNAAADFEQKKAARRVVGVITPAVKQTAKVSDVQRIVPGGANKFSPEFTQHAFTRYMSLGVGIEGEEFQDVVNYWRATNGHISDPKLAGKIKNYYETLFPDASERAAREENALEHMTKLFQTGHQNDKFQGRIYRSTNIEGKPTKWQKQLHKEYKDTK